MVRFLVRVIRRRPRTSLLLASLLGLAAAALTLYAHALHHWHAAHHALAHRQPHQALHHLRFCLWLWSRSPQVHLLAARAARGAGDFPRAEHHLQRCIQLQNGPSQEVQLENWLMRAQWGESDHVAPLLLQLVEQHHPHSPLILETLAGVYMRSLRYGPARHCLNLWIELQPDSATAFHWRGWVRERMGNTREALLDYQQALQLDPQLVQVRLHLAEIFLEEAKAQQALPHLLYLRQEHPDRADILARLGQCSFQLNQPQARSQLEAAVAQLPDDPPLLITLAKLELEDRRPRQAERWLRQALAVDPADPIAQYTLVASLRGQGRVKEAEAALQRYQQHQKKLQEANQLLQNEARQPTTTPEAPHAIGAVLLQIGQDPVGLYWLHEALERDAGHQPTHRLLAEYYQKKGQLEKAAAHRRRLGQAASLR